MGVLLRQLHGPAAAGLGGADAFLGGGDPGGPGGGVGSGDFCRGEIGVAAAGGGGGLPGLLGKGVGPLPGGSFNLLFRGQAELYVQDQGQGAGRAVVAGSTGRQDIGAAGAGFQGGKC